MVRVPVLSVASTVTEPRASTAGRVRTIAPRSAIRRVAAASASATTAGMDSGMAATARLIPATSMSSQDSPRSRPSTMNRAQAATATTDSRRPRRGEPALQRGGGRGAFAQHPGDPAEFGAGAGGDDDGVAAAVHDQRAAVQHGGPVAGHRVGRAGRVRAPVDRLGLAGEQGLVDLQGVRGEHPGVGADDVAVGDAEDVTGHQVGGADPLRRPAAQHGGGGGGERAERGDGADRAAFLEHPDRGVQRDDQQDDRAVGVVAGHRGQHGGADQYQDHGLAQLPEHGGGERARGLVRQVVGPVGGESGLGFLGAQTAGRVDVEGGDDSWSADATTARRRAGRQGCPSGPPGSKRWSAPRVPRGVQSGVVAVSRDAPATPVTAVTAPTTISTIGSAMSQPMGRAPSGLQEQGHAGQHGGEAGAEDGGRGVRDGCHAGTCSTSTSPAPRSMTTVAGTADGPVRTSAGRRLAGR